MKRHLPAFTDLSPSMQFFVLALAAIPLCVAFGCAAAAEPARFTMRHGVVVAEYAEACPGGTEGCYDPVKHAAYYPRPADREHELEHADGMRHGEWVSAGGAWPWMCARITASGYTHWRVGDTICRTPRGEYVPG